MKITTIEQAREYFEGEAAEINEIHYWEIDGEIDNASGDYQKFSTEKDLIDFCERVRQERENDFDKVEIEKSEKLWAEKKCECGKKLHKHITKHKNIYWICNNCRDRFCYNDNGKKDYTRTKWSVYDFE